MNRTIHGAVLAALVMACIFLAPVRKSLAGEGLYLESESMRVEVGEDDFSIKILDRSGEMILETDGNISYRAVRGQHISRFVLWWFWTRGIITHWVVPDKVVSADREDGSLVVHLGAREVGPALATSWRQDGSVRRPSKRPAGSFPPHAYIR